MEQKYINFRAPQALVDAIDELARQETRRTGLPVDRSGIIRRALEEDLKMRGVEVRKDEQREAS